ncbi:hypothetical protein BDW60DRAFT_8879 [Aspergillus nidulans var. acristatus]
MPLEAKIVLRTPSSYFTRPSPLYPYISKTSFRMSPEIPQGPFSHLRTRARAATDSASPAGKSRPSSRLSSSQAMNPPAGSISQDANSGGQTRVDIHARARATSGNTAVHGNLSRHSSNINGKGP